MFEQRPHAVAENADGFPAAQLPCKSKLGAEALPQVLHLQIGRWLEMAGEAGDALRVRTLETLVKIWLAHVFPLPVVRPAMRCSRRPGGPGPAGGRLLVREDGAQSAGDARR